MTKEEYRAVRFALDLVERLGVEHGFDPAELVNPRTGQPFGAFIERMRFALRAGMWTDGGHEPVYTGGVLRLMGLPPASHFPDVKLVRDEDRLELRFGGAGDTSTVEIPLWTLAGQDLEGAQLWLLAELRRRGYRVTLER